MTKLYGRLSAVIVFLTFHNFTLFSQVILDSIPVVNLDDHLIVYTDSASSLTPEIILADTGGSFAFIPYRALHQPLDPNLTYWGKISIKVKEPTNEIWLTFRGRNYFDGGWNRGNGKSEIWEYDKANILRYHISGADVPHSARQITHGWNINRVSMRWTAGEMKNLLVRIEGNSFRRPPDFGLSLSPPPSQFKMPGPFWMVSSNGYVIYVSFLLGFTLMALIYHLILFVYLQERIYGWFALWLCFPLIAQLMVHPSGFISEYLITNFPSWRSNIWIASAGMVWVAFWQFGRSFIQSERFYPRLDRIIRIIIVILFLNIVCYTILKNIVEFADAIYYPILGILNVAGLIIAIYMIFTRDPRTIYFGGGAIVASAGVILGALWTNDVITLPFDPFLTAILLQIIIYSFGLAYIRQLAAKEKANAEARALVNEREKAEQLVAINQASSKFVPKAYMDFLGLDNILDAKLGTYVERQVTVLFSDIRNYTTLSEELTPRQNFEFINELHNRMGTIIHEYGGFVNQYLGDGLMAIFPEMAEDALKAAKTMQEELKVYNENRQLQGHPLVEIGVGLHSGPLIMGFIGDKNRMDAATISDTVNAASRVEGLTKKYGVPILLSGACRDKIRDIGEFNIRYLGTTRVKGKMRSIELFECFDGDPPESIAQKNASRKTFRKGIKLLMNGRVKKAHRLFEEIASQNSHDFAAKYFLGKRSHDLKDNPEK